MWCWWGLAAPRHVTNLLKSGLLSAVVPKKCNVHPTLKAEVQLLSMLSTMSVHTLTHYFSPFTTHLPSWCENVFFLHPRTWSKQKLNSLTFWGEWHTSISRAAFQKKSEIAMLCRRSLCSHIGSRKLCKLTAWPCTWDSLPVKKMSSQFSAPHDMKSEHTLRIERPFSAERPSDHFPGCPTINVSLGVLPPWEFHDQKNIEGLWHQYWGTTVWSVWNKVVSKGWWLIAIVVRFWVNLTKTLKNTPW